MKLITFAKGCRRLFSLANNPGCPLLCFAGISVTALSKLREVAGASEELISKIARRNQSP